MLIYICNIKSVSGISLINFLQTVISVSFLHNRESVDSKVINLTRYCYLDRVGYLLPDIYQNQAQFDTVFSQNRRNGPGGI